MAERREGRQAEELRPLLERDLGYNLKDLTAKELGALLLAASLPPSPISEETMKRIGAMLGYK